MSGTAVFVLAYVVLAIAACSFGTWLGARDADRFFRDLWDDDETP